MNTFRKAVFCSVLFLIASPMALAQGTYTEIDFPGAIETTALGINVSGDVVGVYNDSASRQHGFFLSGGVFTTIDYPGATATAATGLNDPAQIVGYYQMGAAFHGFLLNGSVFETIDFPGSYGTLASGINNSGEVAGYYFVKPNHTLGFLYSGGNFSSIRPPGQYADAYLNGLNNVSDFIGDVNPTPNTPGHSFHLNARYTPVAFPGAAWTIARGVNDNNFVVGYYPLSSNRDSGFVLTKGNYYTIKVPGALSTVCLGINAFNQIVGQYEDSNTNYHGFLRTP